MKEFLVLVLAFALAGGAATIVRGADRVPTSVVAADYSRACASAGATQFFGCIPMLSTGCMHRVITSLSIALGSRAVVRSYIAAVGIWHRWFDGDGCRDALPPWKLSGPRGHGRAIPVTMSRQSPTVQPFPPRPTKEPPAGPGSIHEIKHDPCPAGCGARATVHPPWHRFYRPLPQRLLPQSRACLCGSARSTARPSSSTRTGSLFLI